MTLAETPEAMQRRYRDLTREALAVAKKAPVLDTRAATVLDMASRYVSDADHFMERGDTLRSLAALSYAHGWLDCGARLGLYAVYDDRLFTVDAAEQALIAQKQNAVGSQGKIPQRKKRDAAKPARAKQNTGTKAKTRSA